MSNEALTCPQRHDDGAGGFIQGCAIRINPFLFSRRRAVMDHAEGVSWCVRAVQV